MVPCGVSFPLFFPLLERKEAVGDRTSHRRGRECVSVSGVRMLFLSLSQNLRFCQLPHQREPWRGGERQKTTRFTSPERAARGCTLGYGGRAVGSVGLCPHMKYLRRGRGIWIRFVNLHKIKHSFLTGEPPSFVTLSLACTTQDNISAGLSSFRWRHPYPL